MLPIAYYLLKVIICSGILYGYYWLLLRNKVFHKYNRFYLMASVVLSLLLPLIKISFWQPTAEQPSGVIKVLQVVSSGDEYMDNITVSTGNNVESFDVTQLYPFAYLVVSLILLTVFLHTLFVIFNLLKKYPKQTIDKISFINTDAKSTPFSFLNYIFWNHNIDMETITGNQIFKHEVAHVEEKHTYDKLFINLVLIFFWCNPFYWLYRKELNMIHEFIADKKAVEDSDTAAFAAMILQATYPQHRFQLTNNFFYSPVKRRLLMLTKNKNPKVNYVGRVMVLPLLVLIFAAFTFKAKTINHFYHGKKLTVVIDAGHGGKYVGAKNEDGSILEKDITLALAKTIKELNTNADIEIVLTKETDIFLTKEQKAEFAKSHNAAMYITLHAGATATAAEKEYHLGDPMDDKSGLKLLIGDDDAPNAAQSKIFGSAILNEFKNNYELPVSQELVKRTLYTLEHNTCPSVYIETGLVNNKKDAAYLQSSKGKETIAKNILNAVEKYAAGNLQSTTTPVLVTDVFSKGLPGNAIYINTQYADTNYFKTAAYKTKALVIVDSKEMGNVGMDYVEKSNVQYSSLVTYNPVEAQKIYGDKGKYGVIKLTIKEVLCITADSIYVDEKNNSLKLSGNKTALKGDLSDALIYIEQKQSTIAELNALDPAKISAVTIFKGEKLNDVMDAKGKKAVINVTLKADPLQEVVVTGYKKEKPLYVIDGKVQNDTYNLNSIAPDDIESVNVVKDITAINKYGDRARHGVVEVNTKQKGLPISSTSISVENSLAAIAADNMNVFYIGVDNPITIAAPVKPEDLVVNISSGSVNGSNGKYIVHVTTPGTVTIALSKRDGSKIPGTFNFKVMRVPNPNDNITYSNFDYKIEPKLGIDGVQKVRMDVAQFKAAKKLTAGTGYAVESGTVYFSGAGFPKIAVANISGADLNKLSGFINNCVAGSVVTFDNVRVKGDNGYYATVDGLSIALFSPENNTGNQVFTKAEIEPSYSEGREAWTQYLSKNLNANLPVDEGWKAGTYTIIVQFIVHTDGSVSDVTAMNYQNSKTAQHCIDLIKKSAKWSPAVQNGHTVTAYRKQPITFLITTDDEKKAITKNK
ncbi:N-acetylmuramoyl-L-alanine amidase [Ferruginibacter sp. SUN106]|uniref:N-acetylmuramoyl-L-alanine amidase n=1 Tax=Ferruginibacter sp. SUN106 TaxID=2978348 RepID=UPI003D365381